MVGSNPSSAELSPLKRALVALEKMQARLDAVEGEKREPIAVLGMGCRFPGGVDSPESFWRLLVEGRDAVGVYPADRPGAEAWHHTPSNALTGRLIRHGGFLSAVDQFDPAFFGISPREASRMDPQQRLLLQVSIEALESAGLPLEKIAGSRAGVFVGIHSQSSDYYLLQTAQSDEMDTYTSTGCAHSIVANRLSYALDLRGASVAVDTACSSSLVALHLACQSLRLRESDLAFAGGVNLILAPESSLAFSKLEFLSVDGRCQTFDASANGFVRAEGCGVIVLKRLSDAIRDGDPILAVVRGTALNQDGATNGLTAPNGFSQQAVISSALENARLSADQISFIETHGTGTLLGDPIEVDALRSVFTPGVRRALGAVKTNIGHTEAAAGIAGVIKCVLALRNRTIPPNLHFRALNSNIDLTGSDFNLPAKPIVWESHGPRFAGVSSFGFGGTNGHVILGEAPLSLRTEAALENGVAATPFLLPLSARSEDALRALVRRWVDFLQQANSDMALADLAYTASVRRSHHSYRLAVVAGDRDDLHRRLIDVAQGNNPSGAAPIRLRDNGDRAVFIFSGQGPQWWGMGRELFETETVYRQELERIDPLIRSLVGFSIIEELAKPESQSLLHRTDIAQPALFALQLGLTALWKSWGIEPQAVVGHSVGEVAAAYVAGVLTLEDAVKVICHRGRLMHRPSGRGRMIAVEMPVAEARQVVAPYGNGAGLAAINTPESVTLSGDENAINEIIAGLEKRGISCRALKVDYAFHSPAMDIVKPELRDVLRGIDPRAPSLPMMSTVTGAPLVAGQGGADYWPENIRQPVQFGQAIDRLIGDGFTTFVEISPHPVLGAAVNHRLDSLETKGVVTASLRRNRPERAMLLDALGVLYTVGHPIAWAKISGERRPVVELPGYPWQQKSYWLPVTANRRRNKSGIKDSSDVPVNWYYEATWLERDRSDIPSSLGAARQLLAPESLASNLVAKTADLSASIKLKPVAGTLDDFEKRAARYITAALVRMGFKFSSGLKFTSEGLRNQLEIQPRHARLITRMLEILVEEQRLKFDDQGWEVIADIGLSGEIDPPMELSSVASGPENALLTRCGEQLAEVLRGEVDPLQLLFPSDGSPGAESLYRDSPSAIFYNELVAELIAESSRKLPPGNTLRLLEIGAGTGGTTTQVLEKLSGIRTHYTFTDLARSLVHEARTKYAAQTHVRCAVLDIERPTAAQGFATGGYDVIVAANVLHATTDLRATLENVRSLLAPGGLLVLLETTARRRWIDLTFGLTDGWWRFTDFNLRPAHALLNPAQWCTILRDAGFVAPQALGAGASSGALQEQAVLVARAPLAGSIPTENLLPLSAAAGRWLVFADQAGLILPVVSQIKNGGGTCVIVRSGKKFEISGDQTFVIRADSPEDYRRLLTDGGSWRGVVHGWSVDATINPAEAKPDFQRAEQLACESVLHLLQSVVGTTLGSPPKIWVLTRGAQAVWPRVELKDITQAPLWGFGRTLAIEHPELWGGLLDLDPASDIGAMSCRIAFELCFPDGEDQIALSESSRLVARLEAAKPPSSAQMVIRADANYLVTGGLGGLGPRIARWLIEKGARHLTLVSRRPLPERATWTSLPREHEAYERVGAVLDLELRGAQVTVESVDVGSRSQIEDLFRRLSQQGPALAGVIHAAADIKFCALREMTAAMLNATLRPKVEGTWWLHKFSRDFSLDFFVMFSSATTLFGASRIGHYAASNQALNFLAHCRRAAGLPGLSVDWGAWEEIRLLGDNRSEVERFGLKTMATDRALQAMSHLAADGVAQRMVADVDWPVLKAAFETRGRQRFFEKIETANIPVPMVAGTGAEGGWKQQLIQTAVEDRAELLCGLIANEVRRVLGMDSNAPVAYERGLFEMGLDSLMSVQLKGRLAKALDCSLPATLTFTYPTVTALSSYLLREALPAPVVDSVTAKSEAQFDRAPAAGSVNELEQLSDDEVKSLLSEELDSLSSDLRE